VQEAHGHHSHQAHQRPNQLGLRVFHALSNL
jgi:hypothetical protein